MTPVEKPEIPEDIIKNLNKWACFSRCLHVVQIFLGVAGTASALTVTTFMAELGTFWTKVSSFFAAFSLGILLGFDIGGKANKYRRAWRHLNTAILRYQHIPAYTLDNLIDCYSQTEEIVGDVEFRQPEKPSSK